MILTAALTYYFYANGGPTRDRYLIVKRTMEKSSLKTDFVFVFCRKTVLVRPYGYYSGKL